VLNKKKIALLASSQRRASTAPVQRPQVQQRSSSKQVSAE